MTLMRKISLPNLTPAPAGPSPGKPLRLIYITVKKNSFWSVNVQNGDHVEADNSTYIHKNIKLVLKVWK